MNVVVRLSTNLSAMRAFPSNRFLAGFVTDSLAPRSVFDVCHRHAPFRTPRVFTEGTGRIRHMFLPCSPWRYD